MEGHRRGVAGGASERAGVLLVAGVARLTVIEPCRLAAVVRVGAVGVRDRVGLVHRLVEVAALAAGRARGREARGVLAGVVARPARPARVALEPRVAPRTLRISRRASAVTAAAGGAVVGPGLERAGRRGVERQRQRRAGARQYQRHGGQSYSAPQSVHDSHLPAAAPAAMSQAFTVSPLVLSLIHISEPT